MAVRVLNRFPGANARVLDVRTDGPEPEVVFAADPHGGPEAMWFCFRLEDPQPPSPCPLTVRLTLRFFDNLLGAGDPIKVRPAYRQEGKSWNRLKAPVVTRQPDGQTLLSWSVEYPVARTEVALCYPYARPELEPLLQHSKGYWREDAIGLTSDGRLLTRLHNEAPASGAALPRGLYVVARQHAGETPGSWVLDGLLESVSRSRSTGWLVWAVPFADLDGVVRGDYGKDGPPYDLNRAWGPAPMRHETLVIQRDLRRWRERCRPELVLDLHAPGVCEDAGVYAYAGTAGPPERLKAVESWVNIFGQALKPDYAADEFARQANYASRWNTPKLTDFAHEQLGVAAISLETPYTICRGTIMTAKQYREVGHRIARALLGRW
jgi:hypothetical protein